MHTLHWWAVEAEDRDEAFFIVQDRLIMEDGRNWVDWSDWHVVGGGRWNNVGDGYTDNKDMIISYAEKPELFKETLELCKKYRIDEMNRCLKEINTDRLISDIVDYISNSGIPQDQRFEMNNYYIQQATKMLQDDYSYNSGFYDFVEYSAHMGYVYDRLDNPDNPLVQFLVPIDFHFQEIS